MKRIISFLLSFFLASLYVSGLEVEEINVQFSKEEFLYSTDELGRVVIKSINAPFSYMSDTNSPGLPYMRIGYLIEKMDSFINVLIQTDDSLIMEDVIVAPNPYYVPTNVPVVVNTDYIVPLYANAIYPIDDVEYTGTHSMGGLKYITLHVCPFKYDAANKKLYIRNKMKLSIRLNNAKFSQTSATGKSNGLPILPNYKKLFINHKQIDSIYNNVERQIHNNKAHEKRSALGPDYLIVTNDTLKSAFENLIDWKLTKGLRSKIITTEQIASQYTGGSLQVKIKKAIKDYYNGTYSGLKYVMLAGDVDIVPSLMCRIEFSPTEHIHYTDTTPADLFYGCFDGNFEWDANNNGIFGEINDNVDLVPEIVITRVPISTIDEANSYVSRLLNYERYPNISNRNISILMCGHKMYDYIPAINKSDSEIKADTLYKRKIQPYWNGRRTKLFNTYSGDSINIFNPMNIQEELEKGYTFIDVTTHGNITNWETRYNDNYNLAEAHNLMNTGNSVITTVACYTNAFDYPICLSEAFIRNSDSGILDYLGCSRYGYGSTWPYEQGASSDYIGEFYKSMFNESNGRFGVAVACAKSIWESSCSTNSNPYRWVMLCLNPIGDPEMPVYIEEPKSFDGMDISFENGVLNIDTNESDCQICVSSLEDLGESYYDVYHGTSVSFYTVPDRCTVCVTKPGFIPFVAKCAQNFYLQNETVATNENIIAHNVYVGSNVTSLKPNGPIKVQNGSNVIIYASNVSLVNDFVVEKGTSFEIRTAN